MSEYLVVRFLLIVYQACVLIQHHPHLRSHISTASLCCDLLHYFVAKWTLGPPCEKNAR